MYQRHFAFTRLPFETLAETDELFESNARREAEVRLGHLVDLRGIGLLTGEVGSGKTTVCRRVAAQLHPGLYRVHYVSLTTGNVLDVYKAIAWEIGLPIERSRATARQAIRSEISRLVTEAKQLPVLVIDEAHHLRNDVLEDLRLLTNFAMDAEQRLCLVLVGLTELRRRLAMAMHESLSQRLVVRHHLTGLDRDEVDAYIKHRLRLAGCELPLFEEPAVEALFQSARGLPRQINRIAHYALSAAALDEARTVSAEHLQRARGAAAMTGFPTRAPIELEERPREQQWLVDTLWGEQAVGIVGGEPKCGKSILALDLAVAVAAGVPCLRHFTPTRPGPVLLFAAEDAGHLVRKRLQGIARAAGARFEVLDIAVIDVPTLRLDHLDDRRRLQETVGRIAPRLVILDPLVRLHGVDENTVADVAPILGFLRDLQRRFETAVLLVHHARKSGATRPGQALRGSSELHAWGDSNLYLRRRDRQTLMTVEHRAARGLDDIEIELREDGEEPSLRLRQPPPAGAAPQPETPEHRVLKALAGATTPLSQRQIRERAATRHKTVGAILQKLVQEGRIERNAEGGYSVVAGATDKVAPVDPINGSRRP